MARGKHRTRADGRRHAQHDAVLRQLEAELTAEQQTLAEAEEALSEVRQLQADVEQERIALAEEVAPIAEELRSERDYLRSVLADARAHHSWVHEAWDKFSSAAIDASPGTTRIERIETFSRALGVPAWLNDGTSKLSTEQITRIQRARGERHEASSLSHADAQRSHLKTLLDLGVIAPDLIMPDRRRALIEQGVIAVDDQGAHEIVAVDGSTPDQAEILDEALKLADSVWGSRATNLDPASVHAWGSSPVVSYGDVSGPALQSLGRITRPHERTPKSIGNALLTIELPVPSTSAATRAQLTSYGAERMLTNWRGVIDARQRVAKALELASHPFAQLKPHPHPGHGIATQNSYALAAFSRWLNTQDDTALGQAAVGLTASATYWLPSGQTASFADSEPLTESDRAEMVLPFPNVFLAFAEPLLLEPSGTPTSAEVDRWRHLSQVTHDALRTNESLGDLIAARSRAELSDMSAPGLDEMLASFGAQVEGVLLLSDSLGRPDDLFAWCFTIRGAYGGSLGRFVVPASRSLTQYRDVVDNLTAVVAWAQWHEPDVTTEVPPGMALADVDAVVSTPSFKRDAKRAGAGIRVVNVGATYRSGKSRRAGEEEPVSHVSPHIRRAHWRRQRFGPGLGESKRIRIAPVLVNAHRGDIAPRVYRLRPREVTRQTTV